MNKPGEIQAFVESGKTTKRASYVTEEVCFLLLSQTCFELIVSVMQHYSHMLESLRKGGLTAPMTWYWSALKGVNSRIIEGPISSSSFHITVPHSA
jgi:hypothetical protein